MGKYTSHATLQEDARQNDSRELLNALMKDTISQSNKAGHEANTSARSRALAEELSRANPHRSVSVSDTGVSLGDDSSQLMRALTQHNLDQDRLDRAVERGSKELVGSNIGGMQESLGRLENLTPGAISGKTPLKSVGGFKNLAPNFAVPLLEKFGIMPEGSAAERAALQDVTNTKIYDSTGKAQNEHEGRRLSEGMGLRGMFDSSVAQDALRQMTQTSIDKGQTVEAGIRPAARKLLNSRDAVNTDKLKSFLSGAATAPTQPQAPQAPSIHSMTPEQREARKAELRAKKAKVGQ